LEKSIVYPNDQNDLRKVIELFRSGHNVLNCFSTNLDYEYV